MSNRRMLMTLVVGLLLGVAVGLILPRIAGPTLPSMVRGKQVALDGVVTAKRREQDRLLLTMVTQSGAILATFKEQVSEKSLLVDIGDTIRLNAPAYQPFMTDPRITWVGKSREGPEGQVADEEAMEPPDSLPEQEPDSLARPDTAAAADSSATTPSGRWF